MQVDHRRFELGHPVMTEDGSLSLHQPFYGEEYHSRLGALHESKELYLVASGFLARLGSSDEALAVLDVGLGLGYNALATIEAWRKAPAPPDLTLISLEQNSGLVASLAAKGGTWMTGWTEAWLEDAASLAEVGKNQWVAQLTHTDGSQLEWRVFVGDAASEPLPEVPPLDFIWQDPFSPKKNPELWTIEWFQRLAAVSSPQVMLATYSVARQVRDNLCVAGWTWQKLPALGSKRHWLRSSLDAGVLVSTSEN